MATKRRRRPGGGRKPRYQDPVRLHMLVDKDLAARIDAAVLEEGTTRTDWIRGLCERELERLERRRQKG